MRARLPSLGLISLLLPGSLPAFAQDFQTTWHGLPDIDTYASPAIAGHPGFGNGKLHVAAVAFSGLVAATSTASPGGWGAWQILGPQPCSPSPCVDPAFYADPYTPPVFVADGDTLYLFARGSDDDLHFIRNVGVGPWDAAWQRLTTGGRIRGRFSVAFTHAAPGSSPEVHALFSSGFLQVEVRHVDLSGTLLGTSRVWTGVADGALGSDGSGQLMAFLRTPERLLWTETQLRPWDSPWLREAEIVAGGDAGQFFDLSGAVYFAGAFHAAYAYRYLCDDVSQTYCHQLAHVMIPRGQPAGAVIRPLLYYTPAGDRHARAQLAVYRQKLVAAFADPQGEVHYARLDTADPMLPWAGGEVLQEGHTTALRPALATFDYRPHLSGDPWGQPNFGNDLFAVIVEESTNAVSFLNLSRAALTLEADRQLSFWDSNEQTPTCQHQPSDATAIANPSQDGRPIFTEVGYDIWMLPAWLSSHCFKDAGMLGCQAGNTSGRFPAPCSDTKYPVIIRPTGGIFVCSGVWLNRENDYIAVWEEFGHTLAGMLGFSDNASNPPTQQNGDLTGIPLATLTAGFNLFGESLGTSCPLGSDPSGPNAGRCRGFTGIAGNYDAGTRQHSFIYVVYYYVSDGDQLRDWVGRDLSAGVDLLWRKYDWVREHIYHGVEFRRHAEPMDLWNADCIPGVQLSCGAVYPANSAGGTARVFSYPCTPYGYSGPEMAHTFRFPVEATVTASLTGLSADLDLMLLDTASGPCDSATCTAASTNDGTADESLTFVAAAGRTYHLVVDGYGGAESLYALSISCQTSPPGTVPDTGTPLTVDYDPNGTGLLLSWGSACPVAGLDYAVYRGSLGAWYSHEALACSTDGATTLTVPIEAGSAYYLVAAHDPVYEGSHGTDSAGGTRFPLGASCLGARDLTPCP